jgi:hypothetical protein
VQGPRRPTPDTRSENIKTWGSSSVAYASVSNYGDGLKFPYSVTVTTLAEKRRGLFISWWLLSVTPLTGGQQFNGNYTAVSFGRGTLDDIIRSFSKCFLGLKLFMVMKAVSLLDGSQEAALRTHRKLIKYMFTVQARMVV